MPAASHRKTRPLRLEARIGAVKLSRCERQARPFDKPNVDATILASRYLDVAWQRRSCVLRFATMMSPEWVGALARYNRWMNDKLYGLTATLTDEARKRDAGAFFKSIHGTFNHILLADRVWLARFTGATIPDGFMAPGGIRSLDQELYGDFEQLRRERMLTDDELSEWVSELSPERLAAPLVYVRAGRKQESPLWWAVAHVFNHQTHHRGQVTTLLSQEGYDPGVTDLFAMLREEALRATDVSANHGLLGGGQ